MMRADLIVKASHDVQRICVGTHLSQHCLRRDGEQKHWIAHGDVMGRRKNKDVLVETTPNKLELTLSTGQWNSLQNLLQKIPFCYVLEMWFGG